MNIRLVRNKPDKTCVSPHSEMAPVPNAPEGWQVPETVRAKQVCPLGTMCGALEDTGTPNKWQRREAECPVFPMHHMVHCNMCFRRMPRGHKLSLKDKAREERVAVLMGCAESHKWGTFNEMVDSAYTLVAMRRGPTATEACNEHAEHSKECPHTGKSYASTPHSSVCDTSAANNNNPLNGLDDAVCAQTLVAMRHNGLRAWYGKNCPEEEAEESVASSPGSEDSTYGVLHECCDDSDEVTSGWAEATEFSDFTGSKDGCMDTRTGKENNTEAV